jgi:hypothetical protein
MRLFCFLCILISANSFGANYPTVKAILIKETKLNTKEIQEQHPNTPVCSFARKDYDSEGFGITYREGFYIKGQFGCVYYCGCQGKNFYVTHVYRNEYFDSAIWTSDTGGPSRAKWFICPHSVHADSWKPMYDEVGRSIGYNVQEDNSFFEPRTMSSINILTQWEKQYCH